MDFELQPRTEAGRRLVAIAEEHARDFATRADVHDRESSFAHENIAALAASGYMGALAPAELGGLGIDTAYEYALATNRLARGDASTAIAANMHLDGLWFLALRYRGLKRQGLDRQAERLENGLRLMASGQVISAGALSEPSTDVLHPLVEARRVDGTWRINGLKIFGSLSPAANVLAVNVRVIDADTGESRQAIVNLRKDRPGIVQLDDWDALGMRGSGSQSIRYDNVEVREIESGGPWGDWTEGFFAFLMPGVLGLVAGFLGIAEAAQEHIVASLQGKRKGPGGRLVIERGAIQHQAAENAIDLAASRAMVERTADIMDAIFARYPFGTTPLEVFHPAHADLQATKLFVNQAAIRVVDRALTMSGGSGYLSRSPLSRMYRDVRAGPFMQPLSPNEGYEYIGKLALGLPPDIFE